MPNSDLGGHAGLGKGRVATTRANATEAEKISPPGSGPPEPRPAIPTLPPKTKLDLSQPTVNVPDVPEFTIPAVLSVAADSVAVTHPGNLTFKATGSSSRVIRASSTPTRWGMRRTTANRRKPGGLRWTGWCRTQRIFLCRWSLTPVCCRKSPIRLKQPVTCGLDLTSNRQVQDFLLPPPHSKGNTRKGKRELHTRSNCK